MAAGQRIVQLVCDTYSIFENVSLECWPTN